MPYRCTLFFERCMENFIFTIILLSDQTADEDGNDANRADEADEEPEHAEDAGVGAEGSAVGEFVVYVGLLETPADKEDCQEAAEGHENVRRKIVEEVEDGSAGDLEV